jgi:hypothetical protein
MPTTFVCIDSNILFRVVTQGKPGCEESHWQELTKLVEDGRVSFLLPKIIVLELDKLVRNIDDELAFQIQKAETRLPAFVGKPGKANDKEGGQQGEKGKQWNELTQRFEKFLTEQLATWRERTSADFNQRAGAIWKWLHSTYPKLLPFDAEVLFRARERIFAGRFPWREDIRERPEGDCCIVESLVAFFRSEKPADAQFLMCTENTRDFATTIETAGKGSQGRIYVVSPRFAEDGFPPKNRVFENLKSLLQFIKEAKPAEPPAKEAIKEAEAREIEERVAREEIWSVPQIPTITQLCGQDLQRIHEQFSPEWVAAAESRDYMRGADLAKSMYAVIADLVRNYEHRVSHDTRWRDLVETRDLWEDLLKQSRGQTLPSVAFWTTLDRLMRKTLNVARTLQLAW